MNIEKIKCSTPDFARENVAKLLALFPECAGERSTTSHTGMLRHTQT